MNLRTPILAALLVGLALPAHAEGLTSFHTPSKNIYCLVAEGDEGTLVDCEILAMTNIAPLTPRPADCDLEWGNRFNLSEEGEGYLACTGDTVRDDAGLTLEYGTDYKAGGITCTSSEAGLECRNQGEHGFFLSKGKQKLF